MGKMDIDNIKDRVKKVLKRHGITRAGIFGSYVRGEQKKDSDIDILIQPTEEMSLFDVVSLELELSRELNMNVDLLTYGGIHHLLKNIILKEEVRII